MLLTLFWDAKPEFVETEQMWRRAAVPKPLGANPPQSHLQISPGPLCLPITKLLTENTAKQLQNMYHSLTDHKLSEITAYEPLF